MFGNYQIARPTRPEAQQQRKRRRIPLREVAILSRHIGNAVLPFPRSDRRRYGAMQALSDGALEAFLGAEAIDQRRRIAIDRPRQRPETERLEPAAFDFGQRRRNQIGFDEAALTAWMLLFHHC